MSIPQGFIDEISSYGASCLDGLAEVLAAGEAETSRYFIIDGVSCAKIGEV